MSFTEKSVAVITAGGVGSRFAQGIKIPWNKSKVWIEQDGKTMLEHSLEQLMPIDEIDIIYVLFDFRANREFNASLRQKIARNYSVNIGSCSATKKLTDKNCKIVTYLREKERYASTFLILKEFMQNVQPDATRLLFLYGHSPRPTVYYNKMLRSHEHLTAYTNNTSKYEALIATQVPESTRRLPIPASTLYPKQECESVLLTRKIEPPYVLSSSLIDSATSQDWLCFFDNARTPELLLEAPLLWAPHEFNYKDESDNYMKYIQSEYRECETEEEYRKLYIAK